MNVYFYRKYFVVLVFVFQDIDEFFDFVRNLKHKDDCY